MSRPWRLILQKDTSAAYGLAVDEMTALSVSRNSSPPILHLYNFLPCVVLGRYQSAEEAIDIEECRRQGLEINRRHTGGGTVLMGPKQLALGFSIPRNYPGVGPGINDVFTSLGRVLCKALAKLGLKARFRPKNDIQIGGKKIAGLSASLEERNVAFFHTSLLLNFDFKLMLKVFKLPIKKIKNISCFTRRMTTVRTEKRKKIDLPYFQSLVRKAFEEHFGVSFRIDTFSQWEIDYLDLLLRHRYTNPDWIYTRRHPGVGVGFASAKTRGGLVEVGVTLSGGVIEAAYISGDFFSTSAQVNGIEAALRYCAASKTRIEKKLRPVMREGTIFKVNRDVIVKLTLKAAENARIAREKALKAAEKVRKAEEEKLKREAEAMRAAFKKPEAEQEPQAAEKAKPATKKAKPATKKAKPAAKKAKPAKKVKPAAKKTRPAAKKAKPAPKKPKPAAKKKKDAGKKQTAAKKAAKPARGKASRRKTAKSKARGRKR